MAPCSNLLRCNFLWAICVLFIGTTCESDFIMVDDGSYNKEVVLYLHHILDYGPSSDYVYRGSIPLSSLLPATTTAKTSSKSLSSLERSKLKTLAQKDANYRLRVSTRNDSFETASTTYIKACRLLESELRENLTVYVEPSGQIFGVTLTSPSPPCLGALVDDSDLKHFVTDVFIKHVDAGPSPDTVHYIQKMEWEMEKKLKDAKENKGEKKSFLAKYWMYIVPIVIFLLLSSSSSGQNTGANR